MAATLPSPDDCNCDCTTTCEPAQVPGAQGVAGTNGADGTDGIDAVSLVAAQFAIPAAQASVLVTFTEPPGNAWMVVGQVVAIEGAGTAGVAGYYEVVSLTGTSQATLFNLRDNASGAYASNIDGAGNIAVGMKVSPGGVQGAAGVVAGGTYLEILQDLADLNDATTARGNLGLGTAALAATGVTNGTLPPIDTTFANGDAVFATAAGLQTKTAANARTALALVKGVANTNTPQVDDGAGLTNGELLRATASGIESVTNAIVKTQLGIGAFAVTTKVASYNATTSDDVILCDATAGAIIIALPAAATASGKNLTIKKIDASAFTVTIDGNLGELIDGALTQVISAQWTAIDIVCNGTAWYIV